MMSSDTPVKPIVLHLGDPIRYNIPLSESLFTSFDVRRPSLAELSRPEFIKALKEKRYGDFSALMRPFWNTGGEMGQWDRELIALLPESCKVFASAGAGYDWADVGILAEHGIIYCNGASASTEAVADCFIWHLLSTFRNFTRSSLSARSGEVEQFMDCHLNLIPTSHNPSGHTLGIIGLGNIGSLIARKAVAAFGMKIAYTDVIRKTDIEGELHAEFYENLEEMVSKCDAVVLATPSLPKSCTSSYLITAAVLSHFKRGSRFINIARGSLVDSNALADALDSGHLFAAGLDVFDTEPKINERLLRHNVELTCHNAGGADETWKGFEELAMKNVALVLNGEEPETPVNMHLIPPEKSLGLVKKAQGDAKDEREACETSSWGRWRFWAR